MTTPFTKAAVLEILRTPAASDTFPDMIRRVEALEGCGVKERKTFPILKGEGASIDYQLVADHAEQARANHYQSVGRLAERGGLSWCELYAVLHNRKWEKMADNDAMITCRALEARYLAALEPVAQPEDNAEPHSRPETLAQIEERICSCGAGHGSGEGHTGWCDFTDYQALPPRPAEAAQPETPTPAQFELMCLAIEDVVTGRGFDVDPWQPIETAPKDGTEFDIWCVETHGRFRVPGCKWGRNDYAFSHEPERLLEYRAYDDEPYRSGWQDCERNATHWMPLPKPPGETTSAIPEAVKAYLREVLMVGGWRA